MRVLLVAIIAAATCLSPAPSMGAEARQQVGVSTVIDSFFLDLFSDSELEVLEAGLADTLAGRLQSHITFLDFTTANSPYRLTFLLAPLNRDLPTVRDEIWLYVQLSGPETQMDAQRWALVREGNQSNLSMGSARQFRDLIELRIDDPTIYGKLASDVLSAVPITEHAHAVDSQRPIWILPFRRCDVGLAKECGLLVRLSLQDALGTSEHECAAGRIDEFNPPETSLDEPLESLRHHILCRGNCEGFAEVVGSAQITAIRVFVSEYRAFTEPCVTPIPPGEIEGAPGP